MNEEEKEVLHPTIATRDERRRKRLSRKRKCLSQE